MISKDLNHSIHVIPNYVCPENKIRFLILFEKDVPRILSG